MSLNRTIKVTVIMFCFGILAYGQESSDVNTIESYVTRGIVYNTEWAAEIRGHTHGFSIGYLSGKLKKYNLTTFRKIEIGLQKDSREHIQNTAQQSGLGGFSQYSYGKINYLVPIRISAGRKKYLSEKEKRRGIAMGLSYEGGFTLGLQVPYYLRLLRSDPDRERDRVSIERYSEENAADFLNQAIILGNAGFFQGLGEVSIKPGFNGKFGAHMAWGAYEKRVMALEMGIMTDFYFSPVELIAEQGSKSMFLNLYVSLQMGLRN